MLSESQKTYLRECVRLHLLHVEIREDIEWVIETCKTLFLGMAIGFALSWMFIPAILCFVLAIISWVISAVFSYKNKNTSEKCLSNFEKELEDVENE